MQMDDETAVFYARTGYFNDVGNAILFGVTVESFRKECARHGGKVPETLVCNGIRRRDAFTRHRGYEPVSLIGLVAHFARLEGVELLLEHADGHRSVIVRGGDTSTP